MSHRLISTRSPLFFLIPSLGGAIAIAACSAGVNQHQFTTGTGGDGQGGAAQGPGGQGGELVTIGVGGSSASGCSATCSSDFHAVVDCNGVLLQACSGEMGCDLGTATCKNACDAAVANKQSVGCEYYATYMDQFTPDACFAVFVANTWNTAAHITVDYGGATLPVGNFAHIPQGSGPNLTYKTFDPAVGIPPGELAVLFLSGQQGVAGPGSAPCPLPSAIPSGVMLYAQTGIGKSFRIASDVPVVTYEINPYGGGSAAITGSSLLLPTSVWDQNYIAVNAAPYSVANPSMNIVAMADDTHVTMLPTANVEGGGGIPSSGANQQLKITLQKGQHAQLSQQAELTGSVVQSDKPVGFMAGHQCLNIPVGIAYCDHAEQMIPPVKALGSEYAGVMYRPRKGEPAIWRVVGAVSGTQLTWSTDVGGPKTLNQGEAVMFNTGTPFVVKSQDEGHPFMLFTYMSGSQWQPGLDGYGDADFVISVPPQQYMSQYVFFTDPTYPETNLVLIRAKVNGAFKDVNLDCLGVVGGWQPVGEYEWARVDLITGNFQGVGNCSTGRHEIKSDGRFGLWVWGWGTPLTSFFTENVSYGYPGGMNVQPINQIVIPSTPK